MKLSTKIRYGLRAMLELALNYKMSHIRTSEIAKSQEIPKKYLEHLVSTLRTAGLVKSIRGAHGGFELARRPAEIRVSEIFRALEGSTAITECVDDPDFCPRERLCVTRDIWLEMKGSIDNILESMTLQELVDRQRGKEKHIRGGKNADL